MTLFYVVPPSCSYMLHRPSWFLLKDLPFKPLPLRYLLSSLPTPERGRNHSRYFVSPHMGTTLAGLIGSQMSKNGCIRPSFSDGTFVKSLSVGRILRTGLECPRPTLNS